MAESPTALALPFLLSLRRSRIPIALRFLTAGLRNNPPAEESLRGRAEAPAVAVIGKSDPGRLFRTMLPVSICNGNGLCKRSRDGGRSFAPSSSLQSAGVGGTVSRLHPVPGKRLDRTGSVGPSPEDELPIGRFRLCDRADWGGGPGGGGGRGKSDSQVTGLGEWLVERDDPPARPIPPVDAALLAAGGYIVGPLWLAVDA